MLAALIALLFGGAALALGGSGDPGTGGTAAPGSLGGGDDPGDDGPETAPVSQAEDDTPDLPDSDYALDWGGLTPEEQMMVELINRARMDVSAEVQRLDEPLASGISPADDAPLAVVPTLSEAARDHSQNMDDLQFFDHEDPAGDLPWDRAVDAGHSTTYVGENIAVIGSWGTNFDEQDRVEDLHQGLWNSDGHQRNMLRDDWSEIGVGYDYGSYAGLPGGTYVTAKFSDTGKTYLTGVVIEDGDGDDFYDIGEGEGGVRVTAIDEADPEKIYTTSTWGSGGYTLELPSGTYRVVFEGGGLDSAYEATVAIGDENVKLDVIEDETGGTGMASATMPTTGPDTGAEAMLPLLPPVEEEVLVEEAGEAESVEPVLL